MSNYSRYLKKRAIQENRNDEDLQSTLVNLSNKNALTLQFTSLNMQDPNTSVPTNVTFNKQSLAETSFINIDQPKSVIVEKGLPYSKGEPV